MPELLWNKIIEATSEVAMVTRLSESVCTNSKDKDSVKLFLTFRYSSFY
jgi:hypothetical protein